MSPVENRTIFEGAHFITQTPIGSAAPSISFPKSTGSVELKGQRNEVGTVVKRDAEGAILLNIKLGVHTAFGDGHVLKHRSLSLSFLLERTTKTISMFHF